MGEGGNRKKKKLNVHKTHLIVSKMSLESFTLPRCFCQNSG